MLAPVIAVPSLNSGKFLFPESEDIKKGNYKARGDGSVAKELMMYKHDGLSLDPQHLCRSRAWNPGVGGIDKQILRAPWKN